MRRPLMRAQSLFAVVAVVALCSSLAACAKVADPHAGERDDAERVQDARPPLAVARFDAIAETEPEATWCDTEHEQVPNPDNRIYATWQLFPLTMAEHGIDGTLRALQDVRFTNGSPRNGTNGLIPPCDALAGRLEVVDVRGRVVDASGESPQFDLSAHRFAPGQTVFQMRTRVLCLASCWCGDHMSFFRIARGKIARVVALHDGKVETVSGVTAGCFEGGGVERGADGRPEIHIHRTTLDPGMGRATASMERYVWDGVELRMTVEASKILW